MDTELSIPDTSSSSSFYLYSEGSCRPLKVQMQESTRRMAGVGSLGSREEFLVSIEKGVLVVSVHA